MATEKHTPPPSVESTSRSSDENSIPDSHKAPSQTADDSNSTATRASSTHLSTPGASEAIYDLDTRAYLEIRPSTTPLNLTAVTQAMELLYSRLETATTRGLWNTIRGRASAPLVEWLLVADGRSDTSIRYLVGTTDDDFLEDLETVCRTCLPNSFELKRVQWHPRRIEESLPHITAPSSPTQTPPLAHSEFPTLSIEPDSEAVPPYVAGVEYCGHAMLRRDWLTSLRAFDELLAPSTSQNLTREHTEEPHRIPLASLVEILCEADVPIIYQVVCRPGGSVQALADEYRIDLEREIVTPGDKIADFMFPQTEGEERSSPAEPTPAYRDRLASLDRRDQRHAFQASARAVALSRAEPDKARTAARRLSGALDHLSGEFHEIQSRVITDEDLHTDCTPPGTQLYERLEERICHEPTYETLESRLPWKPHESNGLIVSASELPSFCLLDGVGLTAHGQRALEARHAERTGLSLPSPQLLTRYSGVGQALCRPLTDDRRPHEQRFVLPPSLQDRHLFVIGDTGSGKSVLTVTALLSNTDATAGPEILFDYKGGGTSTEYLQAQYGTKGNLDDVLYFDLTKMLPALSIFDINPLLEAGLSREEARSRIAGHYEEILAGLMGEEQYYSATESTKAIRNHLRALYDPIHGDDAVSHKDLYRALQRTLSDHTPPPTSDERLTEYFVGLLERDRDVFNMILGGAVSRVELIATDDRLAPLFDHVHDETHSEDDEYDDRKDREGQHDLTRETAPYLHPNTRDTREAHFDFTDVINRDGVVIFDFGGMENRIKRAFTLVLLSNLWSALKARSEHPETQSNPPRVNLYLEEAKDVAATQLVDTLLSQGRSFGLSIMLGVQFPGQLDSLDPSNQTYEEALNEIGTFVVGNVSIEDDLAKALATDDIPPAKVARRLSAMRHGEWLIRPAAEFGSPAPRPFLGRSLSPPVGHPAGEQPLTDDEREKFDSAFELLALETWNQAGLAHEQDPIRATRSGTDSESTGEDGSREDSEATLTREAPLRVDSLLTHTKRMPECVSYDEAIDALCCTSCQNRYDPTIEGMRRAIECCHSLAEVDPADIPVCEINLKLTPAERQESEWTDRQLLFVQAVYNAQQLRYDPLEYDLLHDSMIRLQEYVGIESDEINPLLEADVLRHDTDHPHRLYSVSHEGRTAIGESYRQGVDYGHGAGDLEESSQHVFGIEVTRQYFEATYAENPDSRVTEIIPYYDLDDNHRLDVAGLDAEGDIVITAEVERINNDVHRAVPADFDKMAACEPEEAIWVVMKQADGHKVLSALNDPPEGDPRVEKTYAKTTPPQQFRINTPGMTAIYPAEWLRDQF